MTEESFPKPPSAEIMRAQVYEREKQDVENKISAIDELLNNTAGEAGTEARGENALIIATRKQLEAKLLQLQEHYEHGR